MDKKKLSVLISVCCLCLVYSCTNNSPFFSVDLPSLSSEKDKSAENPSTSSKLQGIIERKPSPLTEQEIELAKIAWKFFEKNTQDNGMCNAVDQYPSTTMWDTASYIGGLVSAYELGIIEKHDFNMRMTKLLGMLNRLEFFNNELPNKAYHTQTAIKVDYNNQPGEVGYSAVDMGRMLIWLKIVKERYPIHAAAIDNFVLKWNFSNMIDATGTLFSAMLKDGKINYLQEGRLGYEEYAAKGFQLWGFDTERASKLEPYQTIPIYGIEIPYDSRDPRQLVAHNYVVTESYVLDAIEMGWDLSSDRSSSQDVHTDKVLADFAQRIFAVQEARYKDTGILTARTEHQLDQPPYFVYDTIYSDGYTWNTMDPDGQHMPQFAAVALKGAFGIWAVWDMPYSQTLIDAVGHLYDPEKGFYEGLYENGSGNINIFTANNNGIILECLLYKAHGKILRVGQQQPSPWDKTMEECPPEARERAQCMRNKR